MARRRGGGGNNFQQMAQQRDAMAQKLIDSLDALNKTISAGTGGTGGGGAGGGTGGGGGGGGPTNRARGEGTFGPDATIFHDREERIDRRTAEIGAAFDRQSKASGALASDLAASIGGVGRGVAAALPGVLLGGLRAGAQPAFSGLDAIGGGSTLDSSQNARARAQFAFKQAEIKQEIESDKTLFLHASANGDTEGARRALRAGAEDQERLRTVRGNEERAVGVEEQAKNAVRRQFSRAAEAGAFEGPGAAKFEAILQRSLNLQGRFARGRAALDQKLRGMTINMNQGELGNR